MQAQSADGVIHDFPDGTNPAVIDRAMKNYAQQNQPSVGADIAKSIPDAVVSGLTNFAGAAGSVANMGSTPGPPSGPVEMTGVAKKFNDFFGGSNTYTPGPSRYADSSDYKKAAEGVTGELYKPQTSIGKVAHAGVEAVSNPLSYLGPGGAALKVGGAVISGAGGETAGQAAEGTGYETPARLGGALLGGVAAAKAIGPTAAKAAIPTADELKTAAKQGYREARNSGLEVDPQQFSGVASQIEQDLVSQHDFTPKIAGKTFDILREVQAPPGGATLTTANLGAIRKNLKAVADEVQPSQGAFAKPTPDAAAATIALDRLNGYLENIPQNHVVAGDAAQFVRATKEANANYAAGSRTGDLDARLTKAEHATDRQIAGSLDSQIKTKAGQMLDSPHRLRGMNDAERAQLELINSGTPVSNTLRQLGRGGAGVIPIMGQIAAGVPLAMATGGQSVIPQAIGAALLYGARKGSEAITNNRAKTLAEMLAKRSPEYEARVNALPPPSPSAHHGAALARALIGAAR